MVMINCRWWLVSQNQEPKHGLLKLDLRARQEIKTSQSRTLMPDVVSFPQEWWRLRKERWLLLKIFEDHVKPSAAMMKSREKTRTVTLRVSHIATEIHSALCIHIFGDDFGGFYDTTRLRIKIHPPKTNMEPQIADVSMFLHGLKFSGPFSGSMCVFEGATWTTESPLDTPTTNSHCLTPALVQCFYPGGTLQLLLRSLGPRIMNHQLIMDVCWIDCLRLQEKLHQDQQAPRSFTSPNFPNQNLQRLAWSKGLAIHHCQMVP